MWGATLAALQAITAMAPWTCIEYAVHNDQDSCEMILHYPREIKEGSDALEAKLKAAGCSSITYVTFPNDRNKTAAACVGRIRDKSNAPGYSYCRLGQHSDELENRVKAASGASEGPALSTQQQFDEKTKAMVDATAKHAEHTAGRVDYIGESVDDVKRDMASKEVVEEMRDRVDTMLIQMESMGKKNADQNAQIRSYEDSAKNLQATIDRLQSDKRAIEAKRDEHEKKVKEQAYVLGRLCPVEVAFEGTKQSLIAMTNYRAAAEQKTLDLKVSTDAIIQGLRGELRNEKKELELLSVKLNDERRAWADERARLVAAAGNNEGDIIQRYDEYWAKCAQAYMQSTKRARTDDDIGSSSSSGSSSSDA